MTTQKDKRNTISWNASSWRKKSYPQTKRKKGGNRKGLETREKQGRTLLGQLECLLQSYVQVYFRISMKYFPSSQRDRCMIHSLKIHQGKYYILKRKQTKCVPEFPN